MSKIADALLVGLTVVVVVLLAVSENPPKDGSCPAGYVAVTAVSVLGVSVRYACVPGVRPTN